MWFSDAYRDNVANGTAVRITRRVFAGGLLEEFPLTIAPDGTCGVYGTRVLVNTYVGNDSALIIDLCTNTAIPLIQGEVENGAWCHR